ncbi:MAG: CusA/CzcA family heavy metal efflux RND transporter [Candidatus Lernaella stagnicola]|nr:CusA/CzcA family heavy metal efflux RND transporter [Candidatus Lernaella stagnicola]
MIERIIQASVENRFAVILITLIVIVAGVWAMFDTPVDAIPDLSDVQVIVFTDYAGQAPQVVEDQITYPLASAMLAVPFAKNVRGFSMFGYSMVYVLFEDGTDLYWARSRVLEYLSTIRDRLPEGVTPQLGPDATGVGWAYIYSLTSDRHDLAQLRSLQDWYLKYELTSVPGVAEVASVGGYVRQYQIEVDPERLRAYNVGLGDISRAVRDSNSDVGGRLLEIAETEFMIRGRGYLRSITDLENIPVGVNKQTHTPILLSQLANIQIGPEIRRGVIEFDGQGEAVAGIVLVRFGENTLEVIDRVKTRLAELEKGLPAGVEIHTSYDRSRLIWRAINTLRSKLIEEMIVVALIIMLFLLHFRSSFVAIITLPVGILISFLAMRLLGISANIMSLGGIAIAIGVMVDAAVVMVENLHKHKERDVDRTHQETVIAAAREVGPALFFSLIIITISFLPVFSLQQQEGRMFTPLAYTKTFAMAASALLAVTLVPVLMFYFVRGRIRREQDNPVSRFFIRGYAPVIRAVLKRPLTTVGIALVIALATVWPWTRLGGEFMPPLNEGDLLYMPTTPPGISITKAKELLQQTDKLIKTHPQVEHVLGKVGRAETATDPAPLSMIETHIILKPSSEWPPGKTIEDITRELDARVQFPGLTNAWTMPIKTRIDMLATGIKTPVGIKILGEDLATLGKIGEQIEGLLRGEKDVSSVYAERVTGGNYIDIDIDRVTAARFGLTVGDVQRVISSAIGGMNITETVEGLERYPVNLRFPRELRDSPEKLRRVPVMTKMNHTVPLGQLADIRVSKGPPGIKSENARRTAWVFIDLNTDDVGGFVSRAKKLVGDNIELPEGYSLLWSGQYEYMQRAAKRLRVVVPLTLAIIFLLLFMHFRNISESLIVMLTLPFALVGGVWLMFAAGYNLSVAVAVGFIALAGLAAETGVVMLVYLDNAYRERQNAGLLTSLADLREVVMAGAVDRVRPKLMTVATTTIGLLPIMFGIGTGTRIMKRIAAPMVGGLISSTILTLVILPAIYFLWKKWTTQPALAVEKHDDDEK